MILFLVYVNTNIFSILVKSQTMTLGDQLSQCGRSLDTKNRRDDIINQIFLNSEINIFLCSVDDQSIFRLGHIFKKSCFTHGSI